MSNPSTRSHGRSGSWWLVWIPVLMVAALLFWTVALGLGGLSLMAVSALSAGTQDAVPSVAGPEDSASFTPLGQEDDEPGAASPAGDSIVVHLQESVEPEDVNDNPGCGVSSAGEDPAAMATPGPGATAF